MIDVRPYRNVEVSHLAASGRTKNDGLTVRWRSKQTKNISTFQSHGSLCCSLLQLTAFNTYFHFIQEYPFMEILCVHARTKRAPMILRVKNSAGNNSRKVYSNTVQQSTCIFQVHHSPPYLDVQVQGTNLLYKYVTL